MMKLENRKTRIMRKEYVSEKDLINGQIII